MATDTQWRSIAMVEPAIADSGKPVEMRYADGHVMRGTFRMEYGDNGPDAQPDLLPMLEFEDGSTVSIYKFEDWRPHEEDRNDG